MLSDQVCERSCSSGAMRHRPTASCAFESRKRGLSYSCRLQGGEVLQRIRRFARRRCIFESHFRRTYRGGLDFSGFRKWWTRIAPTRVRANVHVGTYASLTALTLEATDPKRACLFRKTCRCFSLREAKTLSAIAARASSALPRQYRAAGVLHDIKLSTVCQPRVLTSR